MDIHQQIVKFIDAGRTFALATILKAEGSTPRDAGVKAIIDDTGKIYGTLGGGPVEGQAQTTAQKACKSGNSTIFDFQMQGTHAADNTPICGGSMQILIDTNPAKNNTAYFQATNAMINRIPGILLTTIENTNSIPNITARFFSRDDLAELPDIPNPEQILKCLDKEQFAIFETDDSACMIAEPIIPKPMLLILGGGHIGQSLAHQATLVGFNITVTDDRPEFTDSSLFPEQAVCICDDIKKAVENFHITPDTYIVIVTRGHKHDADALEACIHSPVAYIGMIGSKRKVALMRSHFIKSGFAKEAQFDKVFAPIGLDIAAVTVPEIAASITAQLIAVRRNAANPVNPDRMVYK